MLESLSFPNIDDREEEIAEPYARTFQWLLDDTPSGNWRRDGFVKWIDSDESQVYWICGKAGSGKSTLMKNLHKSPKLREDLVKWAGSEKIVIAGFFCYSRGSSALQKSREGLLRSVTYQILVQRKDLVPFALESAPPNQLQILYKMARTRKTERRTCRKPHSSISVPPSSPRKRQSIVDTPRRVRLLRDAEATAGKLPRT
jgi:hypothetical protein